VCWWRSDVVAVLVILLELFTSTTMLAGRRYDCNLSVAYFLCELTFFLSLHRNEYELVATHFCVILIADVRYYYLFVAVLVHPSAELNTVVVHC
jgi:hypothetical protein